MNIPVLLTTKHSCFENYATEVALINLFRQYRITGWRRNQNVFGKPDFLFRRNRLALFVDGCFWHGCPQHCKIPTGNRAFWKKKFAANKARDRRVNRELRRLGWRVIRIWEHDLAPPGRGMHPPDSECHRLISAFSFQLSEFQILLLENSSRSASRQPASANRLRSASSSAEEEAAAAEQ